MGNNLTVKFGRMKIKLGNKVIEKMPVVIIPELSAEECIENFGDFLEFGADPNYIARVMRRNYGSDFEMNADFVLVCIKYGVDVCFIKEQCHTLLYYGRLDDESRKNIIDYLFQRGMDFGDILSAFDAKFVVAHYRELLKHDVSVQKLAQMVCPVEGSLKCLYDFIKAGVHVKKLFFRLMNGDKFNMRFIANCYEAFLEHGVCIADIFSAAVIAYRNSKIRADRIPSSSFDDRFLIDMFKYGLSGTAVMAHINEPCLAELLIEKYDIFTGVGKMSVDLQYLIDKYLISANTVIKNFNFLYSHNVKIDIDWLINELEAKSLIRYFDVLEQHGVKLQFERIAKRLDMYGAEELEDILNAHGYNFAEVDKHSSSIILIKHEAE